MQDLAQRRCFNHVIREAVARCPECGRYFCRECVTEHADRVLCASCLGKKIKSSATRRSGLNGLIQIVQFLLGAMVLWIFFYYLGQILLSLPSSFHEGSIWNAEWWNNQ
jgi:hypothetical protein